MSRSTAYEREPCPVRVMGDVGGGFGIGIIGGTIWHAVKGARAAPKGEKWMGMMFNVVKRAPRTGLAFASWGGSFSILDCVISQFIRRKEDIWGPIIAGTIVGASLPVRRGRSAMILGGIGGFVILSAIEGLQVYLSNQHDPTSNQQAPPESTWRANYQ